MAERIYRYEVPVDDQWHDIVMTGSPLPLGARYWGTAVAPGGRLVWHLVEAG